MFLRYKGFHRAPVTEHERRGPGVPNDRIRTDARYTGSTSRHLNHSVVRIPGNAHPSDPVTETRHRRADGARLQTMISKLIKVLRQGRLGGGTIGPVAPRPVTDRPGWRYSRVPGKAWRSEARTRKPGWSAPKERMPGPPREPESAHTGTGDPSLLRPARQAPGRGRTTGSREIPEKCNEKMPGDRTPRDPPQAPLPITGSTSTSPKNSSWTSSTTPSSIRKRSGM